LLVIERRNTVQTSTTSRKPSTARPGHARRVGWTRRLVTDVLFVARRDRKFVLLPLVLLLLLLAALVVVSSSLGPLAPFIYPLF
jgi:hypothetical protein